jgi:hypothetical protein
MRFLWFFGVIAQFLPLLVFFTNNARAGQVL